MKNNKVQILITGATGYIGYNFTKYLLNKGFIVHLLVRETSNLRDLSSINNTVIHYYTSKSSSIEIIFNKNEIDYVVHLASVSQYDEKDDPRILVKLNGVCIGLTSELFEVIKNQDHSVGFINVGTMWQTKKNIDNAYTLYKIFQEELVKFFSINYGIKSISILLTDIYGPNDFRQKLLNEVKTSIRENKEVYINHPNAIMYPVYIDDVCEALYHTISLLDKQTINFNRYMVQPNNSIKVKDLITLCEHITSSFINVNYSREPQISNSTFNNEIDALPMWETTVDLNTGLVRFFEDKE